MTAEGREPQVGSQSLAGEPGPGRKGTPHLLCDGHLTRGHTAYLVKSYVIREVKQLVQGHPARHWQSQGYNQGRVRLRPLLLCLLPLGFNVNNGLSTSITAARAFSAFPDPDGGEKGLVLHHGNPPHQVRPGVRGCGMRGGVAW